MYNIFILMLILLLYFSRALFLNTEYLRHNVGGCRELKTAVWNAVWKKRKIVVDRTVIFASTQ
jgi:hypothetical protein